MVAGELVAQGTPSELKTQQPGRILELMTDAPQRANNLLKQELEGWRVSLFGDRLHIIIDEEAETGVRRITERLASAGIKVMNAHEQPYSLEDVFIAIVERMRREGKSAEE